MLDQKDLEAIRGVFKEEMQSEFKGETFKSAVRGVIREEFEGEPFKSAVRGVVHEEIGEVLEQIVLPRFDSLETRVDGLENRMDGLENRMDRIEATMVTKDYLDDRLADFKASLKESGGKALRQIKTMATELHRNGGLTTDQLIQITTG
jgi:polyhydroxyalkanoate synthesis regulator phasin